MELHSAGVIKATLKFFYDFNIGLARNISLCWAQLHPGVAVGLCASLSLWTKEDYQQRKSAIYGCEHIYMLKRVWYRFNVVHVEIWSGWKCNRCLICVRCWSGSSCDSSCPRIQSENLKFAEAPLSAAPPVPVHWGVFFLSWGCRDNRQPTILQLQGKRSRQLIVLEYERERSRELHCGIASISCLRQR